MHPPATTAANRKKRPLPGRHARFRRAFLVVRHPIACREKRCALFERPSAQIVMIISPGVWQQLLKYVLCAHGLSLALKDEHRIAAHRLAARLAACLGIVICAVALNGHFSSHAEPPFAFLSAALLTITVPCPPCTKTLRLSCNSVIRGPAVRHRGGPWGACAAI